MDKVLQVQHLSVLDLLDPSEVNKRASILPPSGDEFENVLLTEPSAAIQPLITAMHVKEILKFRKTFLRKLRPKRKESLHWQRFVLDQTRSPKKPSPCRPPLTRHHASDRPPLQRTYALSQGRI